MNSGKILAAQQGSVYLLKLTGDVRVTLCASLRDYIDTIFKGEKATDVFVDLLEARGVDSTTLGLLAKLAIHSESNLGFKAKLLCVNHDILRVIETMGLDELFEVLSIPDAPELPLSDLTPGSDSEPNVALIRQQVLEAHKLLVKLNPRLMGEFIDLINDLEESSG